MAKATRNAPKGQRTRQKKNKWPLLLAFGGVVILVMAIFIASQKSATPYTPEVTGSPSLKADKELVDLGDVKLGKGVKVSFEISNVGDQPLRFLKAPYIEVREGC